MAQKPLEESTVECCGPGTFQIVLCPRVGALTEEGRQIKQLMSLWDRICSQVGTWKHSVAEIGHTLKGHPKAPFSLLLIHNYYC